MPAISAYSLFNDGFLPNTLEAQLHSVIEQVNNISKDQFMISSEDEIVDYVLPKMYMDPIVLDYEDAVLEIQETDVDVRRGHLHNNLLDITSSIKVPGSQVSIKIPFIGDARLWRLRPSRGLGVTPSAKIQAQESRKQGLLILIFEQPSGSSPKSIIEEKENQLRWLKDYLKFQEEDIRSYNEKLDSQIRNAIQARRHRLKEQEGIATMLGIPLEKKGGAP